MKNLKIKITLALLAANSAYATTPTPTPVPSGAGATQSEIGAHVNVIRDTIEDAIRKMDERKGETDFKMKDYWAQLPGFKKQVALAMDEFRQEMGNEKSGILGRIALVMNRYNSIYASNSFSPEQKTILLKGAYDYITEQMKGIQTEYESAIQRAIMKVYGNLPVSIAIEVLESYTTDKNEAEKFKSKNCSTKKRYFQNYYVGYSNIGYDGKSLDTYGFCLYRFRWSDGRTLYEYSDSKENSYQNIQGYSNKLYDLPAYKVTLVESYKKYFYPLVAKGCKSEICVGMRSGDLVFAHTLLHSSINRDLVFKLASGDVVRLISMKKVDVNFVNQMLSTSEYPVKLPFDTE